MNSLTNEEFAMLVGTETAIKMMRNRKRYSLDTNEYMSICELVKTTSSGFYHFKVTPEGDCYSVLMYFENPGDLSLVEQTLYLARNNN